MKGPLLKAVLLCGVEEAEVGELTSSLLRSQLTAVPWARDSRVHRRGKPAASEGQMCHPPGLGRVSMEVTVLWVTWDSQAGREAFQLKSILL